MDLVFHPIEYFNRIAPPVGDGADAGKCSDDLFEIARAMEIILTSNDSLAGPYNRLCEWYLRRERGEIDVEDEEVIDHTPFQVEDGRHVIDATVAMLPVKTQRLYNVRVRLQNDPDPEGA
jgi:hypothetical protein